MFSYLIAMLYTYMYPRTYAHVTKVSSDTLLVSFYMLNLITMNFSAAYNSSLTLNLSFLC